MRCPGILGALARAQRRAAGDRRRSLSRPTGERAPARRWVVWLDRRRPTLTALELERRPSVQPRDRAESDEAAGRSTEPSAATARPRAEVHASNAPSEPHGADDLPLPARRRSATTTRCRRLAAGEASGPLTTASHRRGDESSRAPAVSQREVVHQPGSPRGVVFRVIPQPAPSRSHRLHNARGRRSRPTANLWTRRPKRRRARNFAVLREETVVWAHAAARNSGIAIATAFAQSRMVSVPSRRARARATLSAAPRVPRRRAAARREMRFGQRRDASRSVRDPRGCPLPRPSCRFGCRTVGALIGHTTSAGRRRPLGRRPEVATSNLCDPHRAGGG